MTPFGALDAVKTPLDAEDVVASGPSRPERLIGQMLGGYRLVRALGKGATGVVFLGERANDPGCDA
jgi:hypothetical protein